MPGRACLREQAASVEFLLDCEMPRFWRLLDGPYTALIRAPRRPSGIHMRRCAHARREINRCCRLVRADLSVPETGAAAGD
jgi:hypothetical protein